MKVLNIPIEPLPMRYSKDWDWWFRKTFTDYAIHYRTIRGKDVPEEIQSGSFLDVIHTNTYKTSQLQYILNILAEYDNKETLVLFFHDLWFPGLETIAYIRNGMGFTNLKICGCVHAGSYDEFDFLNKKGMTPWASHIEHAWFSHIADAIFVATDYHKKLLCKHRLPKALYNKVHVTGFPIYPILSGTTLKENIIVFPHRLDSEKNPIIFDNLAKKFAYSDWRFIKTVDAVKTKNEYYALLKKAKFAISFADQETWGIAMQEAVLCGCVPLCPDRLSYSEMYLDTFLYNIINDIVYVLENKPYETFLPELDIQQRKILSNGEYAIPNMINIIKNL